MEQSLHKPELIHVVAAIVWHPNIAGTLLISRRQQGKHLEHFWELPGGKKETDEKAYQALTRELLEEVNIKDITSEPFIQVTHDYPDRSVLLDVWQVKAFKGEVYGREGQEICWVSIEEINEYQFPDANKSVLEIIVSNVKA